MKGREREGERGGNREGGREREGERERERGREAERERERVGVAPRALHLEHTVFDLLHIERNTRLNHRIETKVATIGSKPK